MLLVRDIAHIPAPLPHPVMALGVFDGLHLGHQVILRRVVARARENNGCAVLVTFEPHPQKVISPADAPLLLQTSTQKQELLAALGIDLLVIIPFTRRLSLYSPREFVEKVLQPSGVREIYVGQNFRFGHKRAGDFNQLKVLGKELGFEVFSTEPVCFRGARISSTRIRSHLQEGRAALARRLLGRPYQLVGTVVRGAGRGKGLGFPTANLKPENELIPATGVYASRIHYQQAVYVAATNVGYRPTLYGAAEKEAVVEIHLLNFDGNLYGRSLRLDFCLRLREERKFANIDALKRQMQKDIQRITRYSKHVP